MTEVQTRLIDLIREAAVPLSGGEGDYDALLRLTKDRHFILLGEASHGTEDFYAARAEITKRLIMEQGLTAIAIEGDWPSVYRVNRFVRGVGSDSDAGQALSDFRRFPLWMWRNTVFLDFVRWLRDYNLGQPETRRVGVYGLDMYSLYESIAEILSYLDSVDPMAADEARGRYGCLDNVADEQGYGYGVHLGRVPSCEEDVIAQLESLRNKSADYLMHDGTDAQDEQFQAEQNARLVKNAEQYYRNMFSSRVSTWNMRDQHMGETLDALHRHLSARTGNKARIAVWAHNSHLGDARATAMGDRGELNLGQLCRERYGDGALLVGFTTHTGSVTAASSWDGPAECKAVRPSLAGSHEHLFHETGIRRFFLSPNETLLRRYRHSQLERAIGVLYLPESERISHYFRARLADQFDAVFHFDQSSALRPLDGVPAWDPSAPDTYPSGL